MNLVKSKKNLTNKDNLEIDNIVIKNNELEEKILNINAELVSTQIELACSLVTQKAFIEIAYQYGIKLNKSLSEIKLLSFKEELDVLENKNNPIHETNSNEFIDYFREKIKEKFESRKYNFQNEFIPLLLSGKTSVIDDEDYVYWFEAIEKWLVLARDGNVEAQKNLIVCFNLGYGTDINKEYEDYWFKKLNKENVVEPTFKKEEDKITESIIVNKTNDDKNEEINEEINEDVELLIKKVKLIKNELKKIPNIYIKTHPAIEKLNEINLFHKNLPIEQKNEIFGDALCLHNSEFLFNIKNKKNYGNFFHSDKRGDIYLTIINNSEWEPLLYILAKDNLGNVFKSKFKINIGRGQPICIFSKQPIGTKLVSISFGTVEKIPVIYTYLPRNIII